MDFGGRRRGGYYDIMASSLRPSILSCHPLCLKYLQEAVQTTCHHTHTPCHTHSWPVVENYLEYLLKYWTSVQFQGLYVRFILLLFYTTTSQMYLFDNGAEQLEELLTGFVVMISIFFENK